MRLDKSLQHTRKIVLSLSLVQGWKFIQEILHKYLKNAFKNIYENPFWRTSEKAPQSSSENCFRWSSGDSIRNIFNRFHPNLPWTISPRVYSTIPPRGSLRIPFSDPPALLSEAYSSLPHNLIFFPEIPTKEPPGILPEWYWEFCRVPSELTQGALQEFLPKYLRKFLLENIW